MNFLEKLIPIKKAEIERLRKNPPQFKPVAKRESFKKSLARPGQCHVIGEIKLHSPSKGTMSKESAIESLVDLYDQYASAISVLTDEHFFKGNFNRLNQIATRTKKPLLCKDFIIDTAQIKWAKQAGASAILLITTLLTIESLKKLYQAAKKKGLEILVEIHDKDDLKKALSIKAEIIGINHRNLKTLEIDMQTTHRLRPLIPKETIVVAESGIHSKADRDALPQVNAILVGTSLMTSSDPQSLIQALCQHQNPKQ